MSYEYNWKNKEANFGPPIQKQVDGGAHITFEIILKKGSKFIALRRPDGIPEHELPAHAGNYPKGFLYFCHNLIRYGESVEKCVARIVKAQAGVGVRKVKVIAIYSEVQKKDNQWAFMPHIIAEVDKTPQPGVYGNKVTEVVVFDKHNVPNEMAWWKKRELEEFLRSLE